MSPEAPSSNERRTSWLILATLWLMLLVFASMRPLAVPDEGRYGEIGRWMLVSGDWLTPRLNGLPFFHKPPLLHWLDAISLATFGTSAWALRLVPALHAGLMMAALYLAARRFSSETIARRSAIMFGTGLGFWVGGQYVNHDMLVATWISLAIWCFAFAFMAGAKPDAWLARLGFLACAMGMLSKGLISFALPGLVLLIWLLWTRQLKKILYLPWVSGVGLFVLVAGPWFVLAQRTYPEFFNYMFIGQQFNRYTAATYNNPQPWWFYLLALALLLFPWLFFALGQVRRVTSMTRASAIGIDQAWWRLCWSWVLGIVLFFSIPNSKLVGYILPALPPVAVLASLGWDRVMARRSYAGQLFVAICVLNCCIALGIVLKVGDATKKGRSQDVAEVLACAARPSDTIYASGGYPYELPFYVQTTRAIVMVDDWPALRKKSGDSWQRELFEGADFDALAAQVLQQPDVLQTAGLSSGNWLITRADSLYVPHTPDWTLYFKGAGWDLYRSGGASGGSAGSKDNADPRFAGCKGKPK
jgi:4-amino-4-deoxy-L-arabinose transferase-like glycosyltransferase